MTDRRARDPRNRLSSGLNLKRFKQEGNRAAKPTVMFLVGVLIATLMAGWLVLHISRTFGHKTYEVRFQVDNAFGIFEGFDDVRFRGVPAGTIEKIERDGTQLVIVAKIRSKYGPIYKNAHAQLRPITPLNDIYLDVTDPGTPNAGKADPDSPLPEAQTQTSVTVPEVLNGLTADARASTYELLDNLGNGLADRGLKLRQAFVELGPFLQDAGELTHQIALHKQQTAQLIHNTGLLTDELGKRDVELKRLVSTGAATLGTLQQGSGDLDRTLAQVGPTFVQLRSSLASVRGVVDDVDTGLHSLYPVAQRLPAGLDSIQNLSDVLEPAARKLQPAVTSFYGWTKPVTSLLGQGTGATRNLLPQTATLNRVMNDFAICKKGVVGFFQWNASLSKFGDVSGGPIPRGNLAFGVPAPAGTALRDPEKACTPGLPPRGVPTSEDKH